MHYNNGPLKSKASIASEHVPPTVTVVLIEINQLMFQNVYVYICRCMT
jgi:hypothetical protein